MLRYDERYSYLESEDAPESLVDPLKFIALAENGHLRVSLGGEVRFRYQFIENPEWGAQADEPDIFLQRYVAHADFWWRDRARVFLQFRSTWAHGQTGGPSPVDADDLGVAQGFLGLALLRQEYLELRTRVGRQEIWLGSQRLIAIREGPNNRRRFDGVRFDLDWQQWSATTLLARPTEDDPGVFDDGSDSSQALWGLYVVGNEVLTPGLNTDLYYLGFTDDDAVYEQGSGSEKRHTLGTRLWGGAGSWDWNWEAAYQFGRFAGGDIQAWTVATDTGYSFVDAPWTPRLGWNANVASGDRDPNSKSLQSFNALFPRGNYFSHLALLGPRNFFNVHPGIEASPREDLAVAVDVNLYWRLSREDGLYGPSGNLLRASGDSKERFAGTALSAYLGWEMNRYVSFGVAYTHVFPGAFVRDTGPSEDVDFLELTLQTRF
jgi:hypothetical protein